MPREESIKWGFQPAKRPFPKYKEAADDDGRHADVPEVNMENEFERVLHKFGLHTLADRLQYGEDMTESRFSDVEHRINDALCEIQNEVHDVKMQQDAIIIRLSALEEANKERHAAPKNVFAKPGSIVSSVKGTQEKRKG